jgi:hypothetical protein
VEVDWGYRGLTVMATVPAPPTPPRPLELSAAVEGAVAPDGGPCVEPGVDSTAALARLLSILNVSKIYGVRSDISGTDQYATATEVGGGGRDQRTVRVKVQPGAPSGEALALLAGYFSTGRAGPQVEVIPRPGAGGAAAAGTAGAVAAAAPRVTAAPPPTQPVAKPDAAPPAAVSKSAEDPGSGLRTVGWVLTGVGIAGVAVGVIEFLGANSSKNDLTNAQVNGAFPAGYQSTFQSTNDSIKSKQTVAVIAGGVGVAALATGVVMLFVAGGQSSSAHVSVSPAFVPGGGGAMIAGSF